MYKRKFTTRSVDYGDLRRPPLINRINANKMIDETYTLSNPSQL